MPKALIVDDENKNLYLLQVLLKTNGYELDSASNGAEALELARRNRPDIIISDILMPVMDGFSLCRACKGDERLRDIPFVFYTATYTDPKDEELALNLGADRFLIKPTEPDLFLGLIKETLEEAKIGKTAPRHGSIDEIRYIKDYNDALVRKLEQKLAQLETAKHSLELDIEARKITEEALREARNNYATLVDNASVGVYQTNLQGHILFANQDLARMWHFDAPSDLVDSGILARFKNPLDFARLEELLKRDRVVKNFETEMLTRDGEAHTVLLNASLEERTITGIVNDISERKRAEIHLRQQTSRAEALVHTASRLNSNLGLEEVLNAICEETVHALDAPCVAIYLADKSGRSLSIAAEHGLPSVFRDHRINMLLASFGFSGAQSSGTPLVLPDVRAVANFPDADLYLSHDIRTIVSTQLRYQDVIFGSLRVYTTGEPRIFREDELAFLEGLNNQAAQAINNASLFQRVERHLKYIEALHTIDVAIANSVDLRLALKVLVIEVTRQLNVDAAAVLLYQPATQTLVFAAGQGFTTSLAQNATVRLGEGLAGRAALERKQVRVANTTENQKELARADLFYAESFTTYLGTPLIAKGQIIGVLEVFHRASLNPDQEWSNFLDTLAGQAAIAIDSLQSFESLQEANKQLVMAYDDTIEGWSRAMDLRDKETEGHTRRVTQLTLQLAQEMGIGAEEQVHMRRGALLHDMGKLGIPDGILLKADKLSEEEWQIMRRHPQHAYDMLSSIEYLRPALDIPYCHHEKWDGSGYPRRLKGEEIPLAARVFAVVDVWDALTSDRPYRNAWLRQAVVNYIREQSGTHFDPRIAEIFLRLQAT